MRKNIQLILAVLSITISTLFSYQSKNQNVIDVAASVGNYNVPAETYYDDISATSGNALLGELHDLIVSTHKTYPSYDDNKNENYILQTDPGKATNTIKEFYSGVDYPAQTVNASSVGKLNREHVWPKNLSNGLWGESRGGSDMHHIRPTEFRINSTRNNNKYGEVNNHSASTARYVSNENEEEIAIGGYYQNDVFEPLGGNPMEGDVNVKGDVARIIMYVFVHYNNREYLGKNTLDSTSSNLGSIDGSGGGNLPLTNVIDGSKEEAFALMVKWNEEDPVSESEIVRNNAVAKFQGNRNPFIDHPEYLNAIWGDGETIQKEPTSIRLDLTSVQTSFNENEPFNYDGLKVYYVYSDGTSALTNNYRVVAPIMNLGQQEVKVIDNTYNFETSYFISVLEGGSEIPPSESEILPNEYHYQKVTSQLSDYSGQHLIVYENSNVPYIFDGTLENIDDKNNYYQGSYLNEGIIASSDALKDKEITFERYGDGYSLMTSKGIYLNSNGDTNSLNNNQTSPASNIISYVSGGTDIVSSSGAHLRFNSTSNQMRFRYYKSETYTEQKAIQIYALTYDDTYLNLAMNFVNYFNDNIDNVCNYDGSTNMDDLIAVWSDLKTKYNTLDDKSIAYLTDQYNYDEDINEFLSSYDYIVSKYNKDLDNFLNRDVVIKNSFDVFNNNQQNIIIIAIISIGIFCSLSAAILILFNVKRKDEK